MEAKEDTGIPPIALTPVNVGLAALFVLLPILLSSTLQLGLTRPLLTAALRCLVQLFLMSVVLRRIFDAHSPLAVAGIGAALTLLSAHEVWGNKSKRRYDGMFVNTLGSIFFSAVPISVLASAFAMQQRPWWEPSRYVPVLGMILGNCISSAAISSSHVLTSFDSSRDKVEVLLAHGASRVEACRPIATEALRLALMPVINQMSVVGLISIPGMMTGALLGGASVTQAAYLQVIILYTINGTSSLTALFSVLATCSTLVDVQGRVRAERAYSTADYGPLQALQTVWRGVKLMLRRKEGAVRLIEESRG